MLDLEKGHCQLNQNLNSKKMPILHYARSHRCSRPLYLIRFFESHFTSKNFQTLNLTRLRSPTSTLLRPHAKSHPHPLRLSQFLYTIRAPKEGLPAWPYHRPFSTVGLAERTGHILRFLVILQRKSSNVIEINPRSGLHK